MSKTLAEPVIVIGDENAAAKPLMPGFWRRSRACVATWDFSVVSHCSGVTAPGAWKSLPRSCSGSVIDGSVLKNSTLAKKSLIAMPNGG